MSRQITVFVKNSLTVKMVDDPKGKEWHDVFRAFKRFYIDSSDVFIFSHFYVVHVFTFCAAVTISDKGQISSIRFLRIKLKTKQEEKKPTK